MKRLSKLFSYTVIAIFIGTLFSCSNLLEQSPIELQANLQERTAYLKVSVGGKAARTVMPVSDEADFTSLVLKGTKSGGSEEALGSWENLSAMQNAAIPVTSGSWTFTLTAKKGGTSLSGSLQKEIAPGENSLSFNLSISDIGNGDGNFSITLNFAEAENAGRVTKALATLENIDGTVVAGLNGQLLTPSENAVTFSANGIAAGTYRAKVVFYATEGGTDFELATYRELVQISSNLASTATRTIESFDSLYTITYNLNGGTLADGATLQETVTRKSEAITLPSLTRDYYTFDGWFTDESFADGTQVTRLENFTDNVSVYAKFTPITYTITYVLNGGTNADGAVTTYTMDDDIKLPTPTKAESAFKGWYTVEDFSDSKLTGWSKGKLHEDITLYARWNIYIEVKSGLAASEIKKITSNTTIKVKKDKSNDKDSVYIPSLSNALKELLKTNSDVLVTLDISEFNNIVMDEDKKFSGCANLEEIIFPYSVSKFDTLPGFGGCTRLESITIPSGIKTISERCFYNCTSLKSVVIPTSVTKIWPEVFWTCSSIESITFKADEAQWYLKNMLKGEFVLGYFTFNDPTGYNIVHLQNQRYTDTWIMK